MLTHTIFIVLKSLLKHYPIPDNQLEIVAKEILKTLRRIKKQQQELIKDEALAHRFELFWKTYPKKLCKGDARKAWNKIKPDVALTDLILNTLEKEKRCREWNKDGGQYIPHPASWLNAEGWNDEPITVDPVRGTVIPVQEVKPYLFQCRNSKTGWRRHNGDGTETDCEPPIRGTPPQAGSNAIRVDKKDGAIG